MNKHLLMKIIDKKLTSRDFRKGAQSNANSAWFFGVVAAILAYYTSIGWASIPAILSAWSILRSVHATSVANELEVLEAKLEATKAAARGQQ